MLKGHAVYKYHKAPSVGGNLTKCYCYYWATNLNLFKDKGDFIANCITNMMMMKGGK